MQAEIITFALLFGCTAGIVLVLYFIQRHDYKQDRLLWQARETDLLNRFMARNPSELAKLNGNEVKTDVKTAHDRNIEKWKGMK